MNFLENEITDTGERTLESVGEGGQIVKEAFAAFPSGVAALCAQIDGELIGIAASSFTVGVSFYPPMVMFAVQNSSTTWPVLKDAPNIGISILSNNHAAACMQLASKGGDRFAGLSTTTAETGAVLIDGSPVWLDCEVVGEHMAGDHTVVVMEVKSVSAQDGIEPLVFQASGFRELETPVAA
ncbi:flavin reductase family protein [Nesterenkonia salmonea]|uniref:Flavin reductase family protein n=1 Tax=Nesterenkonia salmonea TaxID=1804987 RepID=A0A5R9BLS9_9MICC|nr:flavin reductase family protein [Nesterenkonia salmonea]TLQ01042.1 flavin reductase family protein [Nesterenkonia salmonea]